MNELLAVQSPLILDDLKQTIESSRRFPGLPSGYPTKLRKHLWLKSRGRLCRGRTGPSAAAELHKDPAIAGPLSLGRRPCSVAPAQSGQQDNCREGEVTMRVAGFLAAAGLGLSFATLAGVSGAMAQGGLSAVQGTWLSGVSECAEIYASAGKGTAFKKPVDIFAPAFIISGNRLRTPQASCRIKSAKPAGERQLLLLDCTNAVAGNEIRVLMSRQPDGSLKRYFNAQDVTGTSYKRCSS
jgi:hypothetical protein